jgi:hypothetical protein
VWLERDGGRVSTIDLLGTRFVLLAGSGSSWLGAVRRLDLPSHPDLVAYAIGRGGDFAEADDAWQSAYGVEDDGAVLVRPDGYVAWRSRSRVADPDLVLQAAFDGVLGRA